MLRKSLVLAKPIVQPTGCEHTEKCSNSETISGDISDCENTINEFNQPTISMDNEYQQTEQFSDSDGMFDDEEIESNNESKDEDGVMNLM